MSGKIDFYTNAMSRGRIAHWMLEELGEPYETHWVDYGPPMKSPEYLRINPMGKVPALVHGGSVVTEVPGILTYLAAAYPEKGLIPASPPELAIFYRWMFFVAGPVEQAVTAQSMKWAVSDENKPMLGFGNMADTLGAVETALEAGPWICGGQFTAADVYLGAQLDWGMQFGTIGERESFKAYVARCRERPALGRANAINEQRIAETKQQPPE